MSQLIVKNGTCVLPGRTIKADIFIDSGIIVEVGKIVASQYPILDAEGLYVLPGIIDSQVHFREPGLTHKEDIRSGSQAAALGGVTSFYEMPNTNPATIRLDTLNEKIAIAKEKSLVNFGFFIGASDDNIDDLIASQAIEGCVGIKIFLYRVITVK